MGADELGLMFSGAFNVGVEELGIGAPTAASAFVENGQNALAWCGERDAASKMHAKPRTSRVTCSIILYISRLVPCGSVPGR